MSKDEGTPIAGFETPEEPLDAYSRIVTEVARELLPHVASVRVRGSRGGYAYEGAGSAVVFTDDGYIITNAHVVGRTKGGSVAFADGSETQFDVVGSDPLPRSELTKKIWEYIKGHGLQDTIDKRRINADEKLKLVFDGKTQVNMFEMTKLINEHLK